MEKYFYVYYSYEEYGRGYIGKRECKCLPEEDVKYFGTYRDKTFKPTQKIILEVFSSREEVMKAEIKLHNFYEVHKNPHFANKSKATSTGFYVCMEGEDNPMTKMKGEKSPFYERKLSKEHREKLKQSHKNRVVSEEHKKNIGKSKIGNKNMLGKKHTEETKKLMSEKKKGKPAPNKGKSHSEETKQKIREKRREQIALKKSQQLGGNKS